MSYKWKCALENEVLLESGEIKYSLGSSWINLLHTGVLQYIYFIYLFICTMKTTSIVLKRWCIWKDVMLEGISRYAVGIFSTGWTRMHVDLWWTNTLDYYRDTKINYMLFRNTDNNLC